MARPTKLHKDGRKQKLIDKLAEVEEALARVKAHTHFKSTAGMVAQLDASIRLREAVKITKSLRSDV